MLLLAVPARSGEKAEKEHKNVGARNIVPERVLAGCPHDYASSLNACPHDYASLSTHAFNAIAYDAPERLHGQGFDVGGG